jgi:trehalose-phosphatase
MKKIKNLPDAADFAGALNEKPAALAIFLDFDGTLAEVAETPDAAKLPGGMRLVLERLAARWPVAVISGRDRTDVRAKVGVGGITYAGSHGFDIELAGKAAGGTGAFDGSSDFKGRINAAGERLRDELAGIPGALVEIKHCTVAVHDRRVAEDARALVRAAVEAVLADSPGLRLKPGKRVYEIYPAVDWDKGRAVLWLLDAMKRKDAMPVYIGDDVTDEDAFRALEETFGGRCATVVVMDPKEGRGAESETAAAFRVDGVGGVTAFLRLLLDQG